MKVFGLVFLFLLSITFCEDEFPLDKDVIILTDSTFDKAIEKYEYLLVLFYAPWCGHCKKFHPEYEKAANVLRKENLYLAKVDATVEKILAQKFEIQGLPTVKLFIKGKPIEYTGGRKESDVINWMRKKTGPATKDLKTVDDVEKFQKENDVVLVYFGTNKTDIEEFTKVARKKDDFPFAIVQTENVIKKYTKPRTVVLFKTSDGKKQELTDIKESAIIQFIDRYSVPKIMIKFDEKAAQIIFGKALPAIILFAKGKSEKWKDYEKLMTSVSDKLNGKIKVIITDIKDGIASKLAEYIGIKESDLPSVRILDTRAELKKYTMEDEITELNILKFVEDWENNKLKLYLKSGEEPKNNNGDVLIVVGKTFERDVINNDNDVMILFYAPWCAHCKALHPKYEEVAKKLKAKNPKLVMAKIDATENEVESVNISGFPTVKFYPGNKKDKAPIDYSGDRSVNDIIKFIKINAATPIIYEEDKKEDKKEDKREDKKDEKDKTDEL